STTYSSSIRQLGEIRVYGGARRRQTRCLDIWSKCTGASVDIFPGTPLPVDASPARQSVPVKDPYRDFATLLLSALHSSLRRTQGDSLLLAVSLSLASCSPGHT